MIQTTGGNQDGDTWEFEDPNGKALYYGKDGRFVYSDGSVCHSDVMLPPGTYVGHPGERNSVEPVDGCESQNVPPVVFGQGSYVRPWPPIDPTRDGFKSVPLYIDHDEVGFVGWAIKVVAAIALSVFFLGVFSYGSILALMVKYGR
jgi:hypothetical protein